MNPDFSRLFSDLNRYESTPDRENEQQLYQRLWGKADTFAQELGLFPQYPVQAKSINALHRVRPDGSLQRQIVAELVQQRDGIPIDPNNHQVGTFALRGGVTLLINRQGEVRYSISKPVDGPEGDRRIAQQREYLQRMAASFSLAPYLAFDLERDYNFCVVHRGY